MKFRLTKEAEEDLRSVYRYNESRYGFSHAENYFSLLWAEIEHLNDSTNGDLSVELESEMFRRLVQRRSKRHGHFIYFRRLAEEVVIVRVLHTATTHLEIVESGLED